MDEKEVENYRVAGRIASEVREWSREFVVPGAKALDIAKTIESRIIEKGGAIAFPVNVCINDVTAHYTPKYNDGTMLGNPTLSQWILASMWTDTSQTPHTRWTFQRNMRRL